MELIQVSDKKPKAAIIYTYVPSSQMDELGISIAKQRKEIMNYAQKHRIETNVEFEDLPFSGRSSRKGFDLMLDYINLFRSQRVGINYILVYSPYQLPRSKRRLAALKRDMHATDILIHFVTEKDGA